MLVFVCCSCCVAGQIAVWTSVFISRFVFPLCFSLFFGMGVTDGKPDSCWYSGLVWSCCFCFWLSGLWKVVLYQVTNICWSLIRCHMCEIWTVCVPVVLGDHTVSVSYLRLRFTFMWCTSWSRARLKVELFKCRSNRFHKFGKIIPRIVSLTCRFAQILFYLWEIVWRRQPWTTV